MSLPRRRVLRTRGRVERFPHLVTPSPRYRYRVSDLPEPPPTHPPTDQQPEAAIARLTEHIGAGHLTLAEFDERVRDSYRATSTAELARFTADLPALDTPSPARPAPVAGSSRCSVARTSPAGAGSVAGLTSGFHHG